MRCGIALLGALWLASCDDAAPSPGDSSATVVWPEPSPALWETTSPDGAKAWLFGTVHSLPDGIEWQTPLLNNVVAEADLLMVEIDLRSSAGSRAAFESRAFEPTGTPLLERVPSPERADLEALLGAAGREAHEFYHLDTWAAALQLGNALRCSEAGNGVDRALLAQLPEVVPMESYDTQFAMFDALSQPAQADILVTVAKERDCRAGAERTRDWLAGDTGAMLASVEAGFRGNAELRDSLLDRRNERFARALVEQQLRDPDIAILVAVGAAHLPGPGGVAALLEQSGYSVERIQ